jgi:hypothetical protein
MTHLLRYISEHDEGDDSDVAVHARELQPSLISFRHVPRLPWKGPLRLSSNAIHVTTGGEPEKVRSVDRLLLRHSHFVRNGLVTLLNEEREKAACRKGCVS